MGGDANAEEKFVEGNWYDVRVEHARCDESGSGTPGIMLTLVVLNGEMAGKYIQDDHYISKNNAEPQRDTFLKIFQYDIAKEDHELIGKLEGKECAVKIKIDPKWGVKVTRMRPPGISSDLPPGQRINQLFGNAGPGEADKEWEKDKKF